MLSDSIEELTRKVAELRVALSQTADMRPGSLVQRFKVCGKPTCHCAREGDPGHGPSWSLTHAVAGKTITRVIPHNAVDATQAQIAEYKHFRVTARDLVEASERLCDARLVQRGAASKEAAKKGASKRRSRRKSSQKSKPL
jgi:hypothetical protein